MLTAAKAFCPAKGWRRARGKRGTTRRPRAARAQSGVRPTAGGRRAGAGPAENALRFRAAQAVKARAGSRRTDGVAVTDKTVVHEGEEWFCAYDRSSRIQCVRGCVAKELRGLVTASCRNLRRSGSAAEQRIHQDFRQQWSALAVVLKIARHPQGHRHVGALCSHIAHLHAAMRRLQPHRAPAAASRTCTPPCGASRTASLRMLLRSTSTRCSGTRAATCAAGC